jgi:hypothetical protein
MNQYITPETNRTSRVFDLLVSGSNDFKRELIVFPDNSEPIKGDSPPLPGPNCGCSQVTAAWGEWDLFWFLNHCSVTLFHKYGLF